MFFFFCHKVLSFITIASLVAQEERGQGYENVYKRLKNF